VADEHLLKHRRASLNNHQEELGLLLFAQDVPVLREPMARMLGWIERKWIERQRTKTMQ